ncbi:MAG: helix-turn-helix domain-containing protein [Solirubrobacterales bacterium]
MANDRATVPRLSRAEAKAETRRRLLEAAETVFRREGYHRASLDRIAAEAGFTTGAVYSTFDSKADVMLALLAARAERRRAVWTEVLDSASTVEDFVTEVARRYAREVAAEHDWLAVASEFMIVVGRDEGLQPRYAALHEAGLAALTASIRTWLRRYGERATIEPRRVARVVAALNRGLVLEGLVAPAEVPEELIVEANLALLRGARGGEEKEAGR